MKTAQNSVEPNLENSIIRGHRKINSTDIGFLTQHFPKSLCTEVPKEDDDYVDPVTSYGIPKKKLPISTVTNSPHFQKDCYSFDSMTTQKNDSYLKNFTVSTMKVKKPVKAKLYYLNMKTDQYQRGRLKFNKRFAQLRRYKTRAPSQNP
jgi:hypothetical protein